MLTISASLSEQGLRSDPAHQRRFTEAMMKCMTFVMGKLGAKGVFHNTLLFSGRFLVRLGQSHSRQKLTTGLRILPDTAYR